MSIFKDRINSLLALKYIKMPITSIDLYISNTNDIFRYINGVITFDRCIINKNIKYAKYVKSSNTVNCIVNRDIYIPLFDKPLDIINTDIPLDVMKEIQIPPEIIKQTDSGLIEFIGYDTNNINSAFDYITTRGIMYPIKLLLSKKTYSVLSASVADYITILIALYIGLPSIPTSILFIDDSDSEKFKSYRVPAWVDEYNLTDSSYEFFEKLYDEYISHGSSEHKMNPGLITIEDIREDLRSMQKKAEDELVSQIDQLISKYE